MTLGPHRAATGLTQRAGLAGTDHHPKRCTLARVVDPYQINVAQAYQQLAHARRISFHRGPPASDVFSQHPIMEDPPSLLVDYHSPWQIPDSPLISEEPLKPWNRSSNLLRHVLAFRRLPRIQPPEPGRAADRTLTVEKSKAPIKSPRSPVQGS